MADLIPALLGDVAPAVRELVASIAELSKDAERIGPPAAPPAFARLYEWAEDANKLPQGLLFALYAVFPPDEAAAVADPDAFRLSVEVVAESLAVRRAESGLGRALMHAVERQGSTEPTRDAGIVAGTWQLLTARRIDPVAADGLANLFRGAK